jgi:hypothetical protein
MGLAEIVWLLSRSVIRGILMVEDGLAFIFLATQFCGEATPLVAQVVKEIDTVIGHGQLDTAHQRNTF